MKALNFEFLEATYKEPVLLYNLGIIFYLFSLLANLGIVNKKVEPFPSSLSTQIFPACFSTNSLQRINPKPVPVSFSVPSVDVFLSIR